MNSELSYWAVVPAAGVGKRMLSETPKQYLSIGQATVLDITLYKLLSHKKIEGVVLAISPKDEYWPDSRFYHNEKIITVDGGQERSDSVLNALLRLSAEQTGSTRVLVHDAARPCIKSEDIDALIDTVGSKPDGGLLGVPVKDTMKKTALDKTILSTVDRDQLWHAFTPQMFPLENLLEALEYVREHKLAITDDASAMEIRGFKPLMVEGSAKNIKITRPDDLLLAEFYLQNENL